MNLETIVFVSASELGSGLSSSATPYPISNARLFPVDRNDSAYSEFVPITSVGLNTAIVDPIEENSHRLGYPPYVLGDLFYLFPKGGIYLGGYWDTNSGSFIDGILGTFIASDSLGSWGAYVNAALNYHRNGPYGWPTWKQIRAGEHKIARWQRQNNKIAVLDNNIEIIDSNTAKINGEIYQNDTTDIYGLFAIFDAGNDASVVNKKIFTEYTEPVFTTRYLPFKHEFFVQEDQTRNKINLVINNSYGNNLVYFSNKKLTDKLGLQNDSEQIYNQLKKIYIDGIYLPDQNPFKKFVGMRYRENIFPRETNVGLNRTRNRERYNVGFWRDLRQKRTSENHLFYSNKKFYFEAPQNSQGITLTSQSMWPLDARTDFAADSIWQLTGGIDGAGELQNNYSQYHGQQNNKQVIAAPIYSRLIPMSSSTYQEAFIKVVIANPTAASLAGTTIEINSGSIAAGNLYTFTGVNSTPAANSDQWEWADGDGDTSVIRLARLINVQSIAASHEPLYLRALRSSSAASNTEAITIHAMHVGARGNNFQIRVSASDGTNTEIYVSSSAGAAANNTAVNFEFGSGDPIYFGGQTLWEAGTQAGKNPFYSSYEDFSEDLRRVGKDYSLVPEFRISEHIPKLVEENDGNFLADLPEFLSVSGAAVSSSLDDDFYKTYSTTDFLKHFEVLNEDHESVARPSELTLTCKALMKFHPYDGFYPALRTVQLTNLFSQSYAPIANIGGTEGNFRTMLQPFFAPGILYNSIKSGLAVDYPSYLKESLIASSSALKVARGTRRKYIDEKDLPAGSVTNTSNDFQSEGNIDVTRGRGIDYIFGYDVGAPTTPERRFDIRFPFESLLDPLEYMNTKVLFDDELNPSSSIDSLVDLQGVPSNLYSLAMNNFLASSIDFFLEEGKLTSFVSDPEKQYADKSGYIVPDSKKNKKFVLDVYLLNGDKSDLGKIIQEQYNNSPPFGAWFGDLINGLGNESWLTSDYVSSSIVMYDDRKAFGNPIIEKYGGLSPYFYSASMPNYATVTPPYYDGLSLARITFEPGGTSGIYSIDDIHASMSINFMRLSDTMSGLYYKSIPSFSYDKLFMQATASLILDSIFKKKKVVYGKQDGNDNFLVERVEDDTSESNHWVISTKWETPVLDFSDVSATTPTSGSVRKGMWHQYGTDVSDVPNKGIFLKLSDVNKYEQRDSSPTSPFTISPQEEVESLADLVGFKKESKKIGRIAKSKVVKEAVIAIPYKKTKDNKMVFYSIPRKMIDFALGKDVLGPKSVKPGNSIINMVNAMQEYVIPPKFDFITNSSVNPFAMYIFEFEHSFTKKDLIDIWQNLPPDSLRSIKEPQKTSVSISHPLLLDEFYGITSQGLTGRLAPETQWLVFKVKQKGKWNYFAKTEDSRDDDRFAFQFQPGKKGNNKSDVPDYSYNWPYDYFTMIELINLEADVKYEPGVDVEEGSSVDSISEVNPVTTTTQDPTKQVLEDDGSVGGTTTSAEIGPGIGLGEL